MAGTGRSSLNLTIGLAKVDKQVIHLSKPGFIPTFFFFFFKETPISKQEKTIIPLFFFPAQEDFQKAVSVASA